jgi:hypothetical protein
MTGFQSKRASAQDKLVDQQLIDDVLELIVEDVGRGDLTAIEELLKFAPRENLEAFLKEEGNYE